MVYGPPKNYEHRRVPLPRFLVEMLNDHLSSRQFGACSFVFTSPEGGPLRHRGFYSRHFKPAVLRAGLPDGVRFHDLRHTYAAIMIAKGAHPRAMMERLGHSSVTVTLNTYGHLMPGIDAALTASMDEVGRSAWQGFAAEVGNDVIPMKRGRVGG